MSDQMSAGVTTIILIAYFLLFALSIVSYVFMSLGLMRMAENQGIENPWLAWIPIGNMWIMGELVTERFNGKGGLILLLTSLGMIIPFVNFIAGIAILVLVIMVYYFIYEKYTEKAALHTVLSVFIPCYAAIIIFKSKDNKPLM